MPAPLVQTRIANVVSKMTISNQDKKALTSLLAGIVSDLEQVRAAQAAQNVKLDTAGGTVAGLGTNYNATLTVPKANLTIQP